jgi:hypothetical protein
MCLQNDACGAVCARGGTKENQGVSDGSLKGGFYSKQLLFRFKDEISIVLINLELQGTMWHLMAGTRQ